MNSMNVSGQLNYCYLFQLRMLDCGRREEFFDLMCHDQIADYIECRTRRKHVILNNSRKLFMLGFHMKTKK